MANASLRVAIAGLGPIGKKVAEALDQGIDGLTLTAVSAQNPEKHHNWLGTLKTPPAMLPIEQLSDVADIAIECAPAKLLRSIVAPFVEKGKTAIVLSAGALLENEDLIDMARQNGGQIVVPTGALIGLDAVTAAAVGEIHSVRMVTRKPVQGLAGAPFLVENNIDIEKRAESESTSTRCTLRVNAGSAQISSRVRSGPMPASDSATATFRLAGKPLAASRAEPSKIFKGSLIWSMSILFSTRNGAPARP